MNSDEMKVEICARVAHEANRAWCLAHGDTSQPSWDDAPEWQRQSAVTGVHGVLAGDGPRQSHESWLAEKARTGWQYGPVKDPDRREHPCIVPYADLPPEQQMKDEVFVGTVRVMATALGLLRDQQNGAGSSGETTKQYAARLPWKLEPYYSRHVLAMTEERLESKSAIAAELAWRDARLDELVADIEALNQWLRQLPEVSK